MYHFEGAHEERGPHAEDLTLISSQPNQRLCERLSFSAIGLNGVFSFNKFQILIRITHTYATEEMILRGCHSTLVENIHGISGNCADKSIAQKPSDRKTNSVSNYLQAWKTLVRKSVVRMFEVHLLYRFGVSISWILENNKQCRIRNNPWGRHPLNFLFGFKNVRLHF